MTEERKPIVAGIEPSLDTRESSEAEEKNDADAKPRIFPSAYAAFAYGCLLPSVMIRIDRLQEQGTSDLMLLAVGFAGWILPVLVTVVDLELFRRYPWSPFPNWIRLPFWKEYLEDMVRSAGRMGALILGAGLSAFVQYGLRP